MLGVDSEQDRERERERERETDRQTDNQILVDSAELSEITASIYGIGPPREHVQAKHYNPNQLTNERKEMFKNPSPLSLCVYLISQVNNSDHAPPTC